MGQVKNEMAATTCDVPDCLLSFHLAVLKFFKLAPECFHQRELLCKPELSLQKKTLNIGFLLSNFCFHAVFLLV